MKLCIISNIAPLYRKGIFMQIDKNFSVDWFFGDNIRGANTIKRISLDEFSNAKTLKTSQLCSLLWQENILKLIRNNKYDVFLMLGEPYYISTWIGMLYKKIFSPRKRIYLWSHGWYGRENCIKKYIKRCFFGIADGTFLYGNYAKNIAIKQGNNPEKLWVIHNSLDYSKHIEIRSKLKSSNIYKDYFQNNYHTLIFIGRLTRTKKLNILIEAVHRLQNQGEIYNLVFVGDGEERSALEQLAHETKIPVWFYGSCYDDDINAKLIYNADLCISPGNVGLTAIHTMTFGTPVITHSNLKNQMPEFEAVIPGKTGDFFMEDSVESLSSAISHWFSNNLDRNLIRHNCQVEIDNNWNPDYQIGVLKDILKKQEA